SGEAPARRLCPADPPDRSQRLVDEGADVAAQVVSVDSRETAPPRDERRRGDPPWPERSELRDRPAIASHGQVLTALDALDDVATPIAQLADRHGFHFVDRITGD